MVDGLVFGNQQKNSLLYLMRTTASVKQILESHKTEMNQLFGVKNLALFGSYVRNEQNENSDVDILVEFKETPTLFEFVRAENYLSNLLGLKVDMVMESALKHGIGKQVKLEAITI